MLVVVTIASLFAANSFKSISEVATKNANDAQQATKLADQRALETKLELARSLVNEARMIRRSGRAGQQHQAILKLTEARDLLLELTTRGFAVAGAEWQVLRNEAASALLVPDVVTTARWPRPAGELPKVATDLVHQRYVVIPPGAKKAEIFRLGTGELLGQIEATPGWTFNYSSFSANGNYLAIHSDKPKGLHFWDMRAEPRYLRSMSLPLHWRTMSQDGSVCVCAFDHPLAEFIRVADGEVLAKSDLGIPLFGFPLHPQQPWAALHDKQNLFVFDYQKRAVVWQQTLEAVPLNGAWSQDGRWLVVNFQHVIQGFQAETGRGRASMSLIEREFFPIPAASAGVLIATDWSGSLRVFEPNTGRLRLKSEAKVFSWPRAMGDDGDLSLAFEGRDFVALQPRGGRQKEFGPPETLYLAVNQSGDLAVASRLHEPAEVYHLPTGERLGTLAAVWCEIPLGFADNDRVLLMHGNNAMRRVPSSRSEDGTRWQFGPSQTIAVNGVRDLWGLDQSGNTLVAPNFDRGGLIYDFDPQLGEASILATKPQYDVRSASVSPNGEWTILGGHVNGTVTVYSTSDAKRVRDLVPAGGGRGYFSPDGKWAAVGTFVGGGELFRVEDWESQGKLPGSQIAFAADGKLLAVDNGLSTIEFYTVEPLQKIGQLEIQEQALIAPRRFTADGAGLVAYLMDGRRAVHFDLAGLRRDLQQLQLDWELPPIPVWQPAARPIAIDVITPEQATAAHHRQVQVHAAAQKWRELATTLEQRIVAEASDFFAHYQLCILYIFLEDETGYRRTLERFKRRFIDSSNPGTQEQLAKSVALGKNWIDIEQLPPAVFDNIRHEPPFPDIEGYCLTAAAMLDVAQRREAMALVRLKRAAAWPRADWRLQIHLRCVRAVACMQANQRADAETSYAEALELFADKLASWPTAANELDFWQDLLTARILRREAEVGLFGSKQTDEQRIAYRKSSRD